MPGYENSYGRLGPVPLKPFTFYAGDEQPGWCGVPREALGQRCASAKFDRPDRLKRFAPPTETSFMNPRALRTFVFYCSNHLEPGQFSGLVREHEGDMIRTISLSCAGKVDIPYLLKAFETGADGVAIMTCQKNECRHFEGNLRAHKRAEAVEGLLGEIGLAAGRMAVFECGKQDAGAVLGEIKQFIERVRELPPMDASRGAAIIQQSWEQPGATFGLRPAKCPASLARIVDREREHKPIFPCPRNAQNTDRRVNRQCPAIQRSSQNTFSMSSHKYSKFPQIQ